LLLSQSFPLSFVVFVYFIQFVLEYSGIISIDTFEGFTLFAYHSLGTDFHQVSQWLLDKVEKLLNNRPRKCLNYRTPAEVFWRRKICCDSGQNFRLKFRLMLLNSAKRAIPWTTSIEIFGFSEERQVSMNA